MECITHRSHGEPITLSSSKGEGRRFFDASILGKDKAVQKFLNLVYERRMAPLVRPVFSL